MNTIPTLSGAHLRTYETIFQHPISHNLAWSDVRTLLGELGQTSMEPNGNLKVTRHGHVLILRPPQTKEVADTKELLEIRHFLERTEKRPTDAPEGESHWLVVINHHEARIFRSDAHGTLPQQVFPHQPDDGFRQAHDARDFSTGKEKPAPGRFFEPVAKALKDAGKILLFGTGTGTSSEMEQFAIWLKQHHAELAKRITGKVVIDERHTTEAQLLSRAREFYADPVLVEK